MLLIFITGSIPFFNTTLEEYFTNRMSLGPINGADEGCVGIGLLFIFSAIVGNSIWTTTLINSLNLGQLVLYSFFVAGLITVLINLVNTMKYKISMCQFLY